MIEKYPAPTIAGFVAFLGALLLLLDNVFGISQETQDELLQVAIIGLPLLVGAIAYFKVFSPQTVKTDFSPKTTRGSELVNETVPPALRYHDGR